MYLHFLFPDIMSSHNTSN